MKKITAILVILFAICMGALKAQTIVGQDTILIIKQTAKGSVNFDTIRLQNNTAVHYRYVLTGSAIVQIQNQKNYINGIVEVWISNTNGIYTKDTETSTVNYPGWTFMVNKIGSLLVLQLKMPLSASDRQFIYTVRKEQ